MARASVSCQPRNKGDSGCQRTRLANLGLQELADGLLKRCQSSCGQKTAMAHNMTSNLTNFLPATNKQRSITMEIRCQLRQKKDATRRLYVTSILSWRALRTVTNGQLPITIMLKKWQSSGPNQKQDMCSDTNGVEADFQVKRPSSTSVLFGKARDQMGWTYKLVLRSSSPSHYCLVNGPVPVSVRRLGVS